MMWRLIVEGAQRGAWNMAVDEALAEAVDAARSAPVLRLYRWSPPCLSLGFSQPYEAADAGFCPARGVDVVRRPTGGRAVLHHLELTYAVAAPLGQGPFTHDLQAAYQTICGALVVGLRAVCYRYPTPTWQRICMRRPQIIWKGRGTSSMRFPTGQNQAFNASITSSTGVTGPILVSEPVRMAVPMACAYPISFISRHTLNAFLLIKFLPIPKKYVSPYPRPPSPGPHSPVTLKCRKR